jgi:hypothetical protein
MVKIQSGGKSLSEAVSRIREFDVAQISKSLIHGPALVCENEKNLNLSSLMN